MPAVLPLRCLPLERKIAAVFCVGAQERCGVALKTSLWSLVQRRCHRFFGALHPTVFFFFLILL
jgi:hypothetical protein